MTAGRMPLRAMIGFAAGRQPETEGPSSAAT